MLLDEIKKIKSSTNDLRSFGITLGIFFSLLALFFFWRRNSHSFVWLGASVFFWGFGFFSPGFLKPIQKIWMSLALAMGWVITRVILTFVFCGVLTPIALLARLSGKKFLNTAFREEVKSYWISRIGQESSKEGYEKQFHS